jgi:hypothetical protein
VPSLEQIIRPFVVDPTTPPVPYVTTENEPPPDLVRLNIGIGQTRLSDLSPIVPPPDPPVTPLSTKPQITMQTLSSSYSISVQFYHDETVVEREQGQ